MEEIFYGKWDLLMEDPLLLSRRVNGSARMTIIGSDFSDGIYDWGSSYSLKVAGEKWKVVMENWNDLGPWVLAEINKKFWVSSGYLFKSLDAGDTFIGRGVEASCYCQFKCLNPDIKPPKPSGKPFDFTYNNKNNW
ncbi:MAG: hypothetical protein ABI707_12350 [Ferruginibacter sp.]